MEQTTNKENKNTIEITWQRNQHIQHYHFCQHVFSLTA